VSSLTYNVLDEEGDIIRVLMVGKTPILIDIINMVYKCCVPNCRGNYAGGPKVNVFSFPSDENVHATWIRAIHRKYFVVTNYSKV
jgi:hypothetical protein